MNREMLETKTPNRSKNGADELYRRVVASPGWGSLRFALRALTGLSVIPIGLSLLYGLLYLVLSIITGAAIFAWADGHISPLRIIFYPFVAPMASLFRMGYAQVVIVYSLAILFAILFASIIIAIPHQDKLHPSRRIDLLLAHLARPLWLILVPGFPILFSVYAILTLPRVLERWGWESTLVRRGTGVFVAGMIALSIHLCAGWHPKAWVMPWARYGRRLPSEVWEEAAKTDKHQAMVARAFAGTDPYAITEVLRTENLTPEQRYDLYLKSFPLDQWRTKVTLAEAKALASALGKQWPPEEAWFWISPQDKHDSVLTNPKATPEQKLQRKRTLLASYSDRHRMDPFVPDLQAALDQESTQLWKAGEPARRAEDERYRAEYAEKQKLREAQEIALQSSAQAGNPQAMYDWAMHVSAQPEGPGSKYIRFGEKDAEVIKWMLGAYRGGVRLPRVYPYVIAAYESGQGVPKNQDEADRLQEESGQWKNVLPDRLEKNAKLGRPIAMGQYGVFLIYGQGSWPKNEKKGLDYIDKAVKKGWSDYSAFRDLSNAYRYGLHGLPKDLSKSKRFESMMDLKTK